MLVYRTRERPFYGISTMHGRNRAANEWAWSVSGKRVFVSEDDRITLRTVSKDLVSWHVPAKTAILLPQDPQEWRRT